MKKLLVALVAIAITIGVQAQKIITATSPDGTVAIEFNTGSATYSIINNGKKILADNSLGLTINGKAYAATATKKISVKMIKNADVKPIVPLKFSSIENNYAQLLATFTDGTKLEFRVYNQGVAYRFITNLKGEMCVEDEKIELNIPNEYILHIQPTHHFHFFSYESRYKHLKQGEWTDEKEMAAMPLLIDAGADGKLLVCEADLFDYPCTFFTHTQNGVKAVFPKVPKKEVQEGDRHMRPVETENYIAKTGGSRQLPWRYFVVAKTDADLALNTMNALLSSEAGCQIADTSWITPGRVCWDWWNGLAIYGNDVNFVAGINTATYKYYVDFASKYGFEYVILDEGWNPNVNDIFTCSKGFDIHELIAYAKPKGVKIVPWLSWLAVERNFDTVFKTMEEWGVAGLKIDFMDRSDQWMVNYYERVAKAAADHHLFVDFHGAFKPAGLEYRYPNVLAYEGVLGMENMGGCKPENSIYLPFMRNAVGAMDYTPGAMLSTQPEHYGTDRPNSMSVGTRAYQLALFVAFETGIQMLADSPTMYYRNPDCTQFIADVPVTWDETRVLRAKLGSDYIVAKRKGDTWWLAGMNGTNKAISANLALNFLSPGKNYKATLFTDGVNAHRQAMDYRKATTDANSATQLSVTMARNGGFAAIIRPEN